MRTIPCSLINMMTILFLPAAFAANTAELPNPKITPGGTDATTTQDNLRNTICLNGHIKNVRPPKNYTNLLKKQQIRQYGYADDDPSHYEEDHLIPLSMGGAPRDPKNLWPQPKIGMWNSVKKDELEKKLSNLVCFGRVPLEVAQQEIATDWIKAYRKYLR
jgi:hypothetical protein